MVTTDINSTGWSKRPNGTVPSRIYVAFIILIVLSHIYKTNAIILAVPVVVFNICIWCNTKSYALLKFLNSLKILHVISSKFYTEDLMLDLLKWVEIFGIQLRSYTLWMFISRIFSIYYKKRFLKIWKISGSRIAWSFMEVTWFYWRNYSYC